MIKNASYLLTYLLKFDFANSSDIKFCEGCQTNGHASGAAIIFFYTEHCSVWSFNDNRDGYRLQMGGVDLQQQDRTKKESIATARSYNFADVIL